jgi:transmembrane sensor
MFENEFYIAQLVTSQIKGTITESQRGELDAWINADEGNALHYRKYVDEAELSEKVKDYYKVDSNALFAKITEGIKKDDIGQPGKVLSSDSTPGKVLPRVSRNFRIWSKIGIAAAIALMVFGALWFANRMVGESGATEVRYAGDAVPGKEGATLTLANGKKIRLADAAAGNIADEGGITIRKTAEGELIYSVDGNAEGDGLNTLSTAKGETYQLRLSDGSKVWLNAESSLTYRTSLRGGKSDESDINGVSANEKDFRRVKLTGEAYFEIEKDSVRPFIVESEGQEVKVLGTHFNIKAYADEKTVVTTLLEGSVDVRRSSLPASSINQVELVLKPGEQALNTGNIKVEKADTEAAVAWKAGHIVFKDKSLEDIMRELSRWYNVSVVYAPNAPKGVTFSGAVSRNRNISTVLERMQTTGSVKFEIEGNKVTVMN